MRYIAIGLVMFWGGYILGMVHESSGITDPGWVMGLITIFFLFLLVMKGLGLY